jgi:hypothetical protein
LAFSPLAEAIFSRIPTKGKRATAREFQTRRPGVDLKESDKFEISVRERRDFPRRLLLVLLAFIAVLMVVVSYVALANPIHGAGSNNGPLYAAGGGASGGAGGGQGGASPNPPVTVTVTKVETVTTQVVVSVQQQNGSAVVTITQTRSVTVTRTVTTTVHTKR